MIHGYNARARRALLTSGIVLLALNSISQDGTAAAGTEPNEQLIGSWSLESRVTTGEDGGVLTDPGLSATPRGILIYDRSGHVAAQLSRPGRTEAMLADECRDAQKVKGTPDTAQTILGYDAYFGTYSVDAKDGVVIHHLDSALFPGDIGKSITRRFTLSGDTLKISFNTTLRDGTPVTRTLIWKRMK
jgi:Lipocalin-like domain